MTQSCLLCVPCDEKCQCLIKNGDAPVFLETWFLALPQQPRGFGDEEKHGDEPFLHSGIFDETVIPVTNHCRFL